jgi:hypothetical protein
MTPELPRAPIKRPLEKALAISEQSHRLRFLISLAPLVSVRFMFMPVSPSGNRENVQLIDLRVMVI